MAQDSKEMPAMQETLVPFLGGEDPLEEEIAAHSSILAWGIPWTESLVGCSPWGCKELDMAKYMAQCSLANHKTRSVEAAGSVDCFMDGPLTAH